MKGSRTVLRGVRGSDAPRLPDLTKDVYLTHLKNTKKPISFQSKEVGFFCSIAVRIFADASQRLV
ncbi:hypothetical protein COE67_12290 [Priestia megaterium]|nr:hypothetical protein COJ90_06815 [Priestia megaterium]PGX41832.1 hypothetical protein COE67_12290 [Priestia megaterium]